MELYAYPGDLAAVERCQALAAELALDSVRFWRWDDLHCSSRELIAVGSDRLPVDFAIQRLLGGVQADVLVMHRGKEAEIRAVMRACREWPRRPIFAVTTAQSVEMSLAVLFEHLNFDRRREDQVRRSRQAAEAAG